MHTVKPIESHISFSTHAMTAMTAPPATVLTTNAPIAPYPAVQRAHCMMEMKPFKPHVMIKTRVQIRSAMRANPETSFVSAPLPRPTVMTTTPAPLMSVTPYQAVRMKQIPFVSRVVDHS